MRESLRNARKIDIVQLRVTLVESQPKIWRLIQVPERFTLRKLHEVLQIVMGWTDSHLHEFQADGQRYIDPRTDEDATDGIDERKVRLCDLIPHVDTLEYTYDFGDGWVHEIEVLERFKADPEAGPFPRCVGGDRACPPEDCGGIVGYEEFLKKIGSTVHPEHEEALAWIGGFFDPRGFDANHINRDHLFRKKW